VAISGRKTKSGSKAAALQNVAVLPAHDPTRENRFVKLFLFEPNVHGARAQGNSTHLLKEKEEDRISL
jgi:hypothetical protein